jgi:hypothetical protein
MNMDKINVSALWSMVRYVVVAIGAFVVGIGWTTSADWADLLANLDTLAAGAAGVVAAAIGVYSRIKLIFDAVKN